MRINQKSKRVSPTHPLVAELISAIHITPDDQVSGTLAKVTHWKWLRSDLNAWVKVLNKFDAILEQIIREYEIDEIQLKSFTSESKKTVCEILRFERLLLENSTNRKLFSSYDRLNSLLSSSDIDVLVLSLHLLLRPAQQYSGQAAVSHALGVSTAHLLSIARRWPSLRDYNVNLLDLVSNPGCLTVAALPAEARTVNFILYPTPIKSQINDDVTGTSATPDVMATSTTMPSSKSAGTSSSGSSSVTVYISSEKIIAKEATVLLAEVVQEVKNISADDKFELLCRIRSAKALANRGPADREKLITARILAIAIFGHTHSESQAITSLFLYEPDLIPHIVEVLRLDGGASIVIQSAALAALDAIGRYRNKLHEVLTGVSAGVNHGALMALFRKIVGDISRPDSRLPHSFVDAMLTFVTLLASHQIGGNMVVGAGLIPLLVQLVDNKLPERLQIVPKTTQLLDNILYSLNNALQLFIGARGVETLVDRIEYEIKVGRKEFHDDTKSRDLSSGTGELNVARSTALKHLLRSMQRMMQSSGNSEGLRGLIDSSLLQSIQHIMDFRGLFGPILVPIAINIMATFIHNEPSSLNIIQEKGVPESFYKTVEAGLEPVIELISAVPNAIGALCLNQAGQDQLEARPSVIPCIFAIFTSERHVKVLQDKENAVVVGNTVDELIRHHPILKQAVFSGIISTLSKIETMGKTFSPPANIQRWYYLTRASNFPIAEMEDVLMNASETPVLAETSDSRPALLSPSNNDTIIPEADAQAHGNVIISFMDVTGRFLEGLFQHPAHCKDFVMNTDGLALIGRLTSLPCLPHDFAHSGAVDSIVQVIRTMAEVAPNETVLYLIKIVDASMAETSDFWDGLESNASLCKLVELSPGDKENQQRFRRLITLYIRVSLLADVFSTVGYTHGRAASNLLQSLMSSGASDIVSRLANLHRACVWQMTLFKAEMARQGIILPKSNMHLPTQHESVDDDTIRDEHVLDPDSRMTDGTIREEGAVGISLRRGSAREHNAKALKHLLSGISDSLAPFFQSIIKLLAARRNPDSAQRRNIMSASVVIAKVMESHLLYPDASLEYGDHLASLGYHTFMLGMVYLYLVDDRPSQQTHHTVLLASFVRIGGLKALLKVTTKFVSAIDTIQAIELSSRPDSSRQELLHCYGGLRVAMNLIQPLVTARCLHESGQTALVISRDRPVSADDYFEPHHFLLQMRLAFCPILLTLWEAPWLTVAPVSLIKSVVQSVIELAAGDWEELNTETLADAPSNGSRSAGPDENAISQLTDMGFPRSAAERALTRTRNNVNAATELLLSNPFPLPPDPDPEPVERAPSNSGSQEPTAGLPMQVNELVDATPSVSLRATAEPHEIVLNSDGQRSADNLRQELDVTRSQLRANMPSISLKIVDQHPDLIFDIYGAFSKNVDGESDQAVRLLVADIETFSPAAYDVREESMAVRCRLLALVFADMPSSITDVVGTSLMNILLALLLAHPSCADSEFPATPKWLAAHLLLIESLLTVGTQPQILTVPGENEDVIRTSILAGPLHKENHFIIFDFCLRLLRNPNLPRDEFLAALRLLVLLTRDNKLAQAFIDKKGVLTLFQRLSTASIPGSQSYILLILRHIVEDSQQLRSIMEAEIKRLFSNPRTQVIDIQSYVRHCQAIAVRDPELFVQTTEALSRLQQPYVATYHLTSKADAPEDSEMMRKKAPEIPESLLTLTQTVETMVHFFIAELMQTTQTSSSSVSYQPDLAVTVEIESSRQAYASFLMQCLTELLFSYDLTKLAFLSFSSKRKSLVPAKDSSKHRNVVLQYFFNDLIWFGPLDTLTSPSWRERNSMCTCAISVITALGVDTSLSSDMKEQTADLASVRVFVLDTLIRYMKDVSSLESPEIRYGRLFALAELTYRLLTVRVGTIARKKDEENPTHIAKIMLEKNFVSTLTSALADVDPNYPNVKILVVAILRPLELLTKVAIRMSKNNEKEKELEVVVDSPLTTDDEDDEDGDEDEQGREETPDLYRNSALGIYGGEMEDVRFTQDSGPRGDEDEDEEDADMDFGEETGSEDTSNTDDDEPEQPIDDVWRGHSEDFDANDLIHANGDVEDEDDDEDDDDEDEDDDDDDGDTEDQPEGDDDGEDSVHDPGVIVWDELSDPIMREAIQETEDRRDAGVHQASTDQDLNSDDDEYAAALEGPTTTSHGQEAFNLQQNIQGNFEVMANPQIFVTRRHRHVGDEAFNRSRPNGGQSLEAVTHPLLLNSSISNTQGIAASGRVVRRPRPALTMAWAHSELLQTIEDLISGGGYQLVHHVPVRGRVPGGPEVFTTVTMDSSADMSQNLIHRAAAAAAAAAGFPPLASRPPDRSTETRTFDPQLTLQRWAEEAKIVHGKHVLDRVLRLANHIVVALLPDAIRISNEAKVIAEAQNKTAELLTASNAASSSQLESSDGTISESASTMPIDQSAPADAPALATTPSASDVPAQDIPFHLDHVSAAEDTEMVDAMTNSSSNNNEDSSNPGAGLVQEMAVISADPLEATGESMNPAAAAERITITIHGDLVDITDTGIDPTFLEALPDDMREEVINQHIRDQRAARVERPADSQISNEFLDALPPEIRAEIIQQERLNQARHQDIVRNGSGTGSTAADIDPASFIASLDPQLRQTVLLDQEDGFLQTLPAFMIAEAGAFRDNARSHRSTPRHSGTRPAPSPRKSAPSRDAIQLLDKTGIAVLVRLLFFPQVLRKNHLSKVLLNLCENNRTRTELFNILLNVLHSGTGELAAVDKSFAQMSVKTSHPVQLSSKAAGKQKASNESTLGSITIPNIRNEALPDLVAQRCLEALTYIVTSNETSSLFFLTETEIPSGLRPTMSKKGKGKERQPSAMMHYPVVLLLGLLDRQSLLRTPSIMEAIVGLLAIITRPLVGIANTESTATTEAPVSGPIEEAEIGNQTTSAVGQETVGNSDAPQLPHATDASQVVEKTTEMGITSVTLTSPPVIPPAALRCVVNALTIGECSARTFQHCLALIQHLSYIPDTRDIIAQELKSKAQDFGQSLLSHLDELASALRQSHGESFAGPAAAKFSSASSDQAKLLRVLKTIDYMFSTSKTNNSGDMSDNEKLQSIYASFSFKTLWQKLGDCLAIISEKPSTEHIATVLLPLIEALMVVCRQVGSKPASPQVLKMAASRGSASPRSSASAKDSMEEMFVMFTDSHRKILNLMVRNNPSLMSGSFSLLVHNPRVLDFDNKRNYFTQQLHRRPHPREPGFTLQLNVRRQRVFEDSFQHLQRKTGDQIKYGKLSVRFYDEEGVDAGGVTREWFQILARQMFDPNNALFQPCAADKLTYQPNKNSWINQEHLSFFKFVGRVIGKAIYDGRLLDAYFARSLYRQLLGKKVDYKDVEWVDPEYYKSLCWILDNDPTALDLTFSVEADEFGVSRIAPLKEGGASIPVTQDNKREFVQLSATYRLYSSIKKQIEHLLAGFYEIIPKELVTIFNEQEIELLISGTPDIDIDEWRAATEYNGYTSSDPVIVWWWRALKSFNRDERAKVLSFATGTSRVPLNGFVDLQGVQGVQRFSIHRAYGDINRLPQAHTCFNQIDLPQYSSYDMLRQQILLAINEGGEGFGFA